MVGASLNPLRPQISSLRSQRLSGTVSKKWLGRETALETVMYDYLYVFCMYYMHVLNMYTCRSCSSSGGCWLFFQAILPTKVCSPRRHRCWCFQCRLLRRDGDPRRMGLLLNSPELLDLLLKRMESDYNAVSLKSRRPFGMKELDAHLKTR